MLKAVAKVFFFFSSGISKLVIAHLQDLMLQQKQDERNMLMHMLMQIFKGHSSDLFYKVRGLTGDRVLKKEE